ncbi:spore germination protein [Caloramator sp. Dgby_cultured_2]|uniref:spore germination protein n=1 Tax=Caloramator sp. Dgby_cultured_2 TaxID=3029174 RepID=UPI00237D397C|nr:spore germination protein [Caloramator sp. Dgby_cultured_2]WDU83694.1 spore germination protein [Caloramator sp. Dgby_cultured_2]
MEKLTKDIFSNLEFIISTIPSNFNFIKREIDLNNKTCFVLFISGIADKNLVEEYILKPLLNSNIKAKIKIL